jgi:hypothetical protein
MTRTERTDLRWGSGTAEALPRINRGNDTIKERHTDPAVLPFDAVIYRVRTAQRVPLRTRLLAMGLITADLDDFPLAVYLYAVLGSGFTAACFA